MQRSLTKSSSPTANTIPSTTITTTTTITTPNTIMKLCVLQSANEGCVYEEDDTPANVHQHLIRGGYTDIQVDMIQLHPMNYTQK